MDSIIFSGNVIIGIIMLLIYSISGISIVSFIFNGNMIMLMIMIVVSSIFTFVLYYIGGDVSVENFKLLKLLFLSLMIFILSSYRLLMFIRWEGIRVMSIILIRY